MGEVFPASKNNTYDDLGKFFIQAKFVKPLPGLRTRPHECDAITLLCYPAVNYNRIILFVDLKLNTITCQLKQQCGTRRVSCSYNNVGVIEAAFIRVRLIVLLRAQQILLSSLCCDCLFVCLCRIR